KVALIFVPAHLPGPPRFGRKLKGHWPFSVFLDRKHFRRMANGHKTAFCQTAKLLGRCRLQGYWRPGEGRSASLQCPRSPARLGVVRSRREEARCNQGKSLSSSPAGETTCPSWRGRHPIRTTSLLAQSIYWRACRNLYASCLIASFSSHASS